MRKGIYISVTALIMLLICRFLIRLVDATFGIGDDLWIMVLLLALVNVLIGYCACRIAHRKPM